MGYTHYFEQKRALTKDEFNAIKSATKYIIEQAEYDGIKICSGSGDGEPEITSKSISLNGTNYNDDSHESFYIQKAHLKEFNFCKTARKPYDDVVTSILHFIKFNVPGAFDIGSDGGDEAIDLVKYKFEVVNE